MSNNQFRRSCAMSVFINRRKASLTFTLGFLIASIIAVTGAFAAPPDVPATLGYWAFEGKGPTDTFDGRAGDSSIIAKANRPLSLNRGVYDNALDLSGEHAIRVDGFGNTPFKTFSISAWVRSTDLRGYREIFRQESAHRVLFAFQDSGNILSLGLDINGYVECDAHLDAKQVIDGMWHLCSGTFDGKTMRVYLDGKEIGSLDRPGEIAVDSSVPAFIASSGGTGEFFCGRIDDLRVTATVFSQEDIAGLYQDGMKNIAEASKQLNAAADSVFVSGPTFGETIANTHKQIVEKKVEMDADIAQTLFARIQPKFPAECDNIRAWTGASPVEFLSTTDNDLPMKKAEYLVNLLLEYKPLTEHQWANQTPEDRQRWAEADKVSERFDALRAQGDASRFSPEWFALILEIGPKIQFRPYVNEAVAPYVKPETPPTRNLTADEAREALERDWLHQVDKDPTPDRIKNEIQWTRDIAARIAAAAPDKVDFASQLAELDKVAERATALTASDAPLYFHVRAIKRDIMFRNPVVDFSKVLFVDMPFPAGSEWPHETRHRLGYMAVPGGRLLVLDGLNPAGQLTQLMPQTPLHGTFWRPDVSFDGKKVLFCFKPHNEKSFHIYEINVDGSGLVQLTDGQYDDLDPVYLPDGKHIVFSTSRAHTYVRCMPPTNAFVLARADGDGKNIYLISYNNEPDYLPSVMNDGRLVYTRWEYTDKPLWRAQKLWTANPDGTLVNTMWGNQSVWPDVTKDIRSIPGSERVMFTGSAHHNWFSGSVGIIDPAKGYNFPDGLTKVTADVEWPECGNGPVDPVESSKYHASGKYPAYYSPYPLSEKDFIVSANRDGKFMLYLMDVDGNRELIYEGTNNIFHAIPLKARPVPPVIVDRVTWPKREERLNPKEGVIFSNNVYQNAPEELRGKAKYLRILHIEPKTYTYWNKRPYISTGPVVSTVQSEGVKRVLGTVPIEEDGSVSFVAPPSKSLHFQLLDENYRALQTMRSFVGVMPGESRGCLGCHESHSRAPSLGGKSSALSKPPQTITPPPWGNDTVSYLRYVRPVLDKYCAKCHEGDGEGRKTFDTTERPSEPIFTEPYLTMLGRPTWGAPYTRPEKLPPGWGIANVLMVEAYSTVDPAAYRTPKPMTSMSYKSRLVDIASSGKHHKVKVDALSEQRLIAWIDAVCPYIGDEEIRQMPDPEFQGVDWLAIRPLVKTAPNIVRPGPVD